MDFSRLKKVELPAHVAAGFRDDAEPRGAIVRLHRGAKAPRYVSLHRTAGEIFTARITPDQWVRLKADPAVADVRLADVERLIR